LYFSTYPEVRLACATTLHQGNQIEKTAHSRASALIFSTEWAAESARRHYGVDPKKVHVIPFGANLETIPTPAELEKIILKRAELPCTVLFIGVDWHRKGGETVVQAVQLARAHGFEVRLQIIGCTPPEELFFLPWITVTGFLDKRTADGTAVLEKAYQEASVLFVPSLAECYGLVYCEACAYGIPSLANAVGGVSTIIRHGRNGFLCAPDDLPQTHADNLLTLLRDPQLYRQMSVNARADFESHLNWEVAGLRATELLQSLVKS